MHLWRGPDGILVDERFSCHRPPAGLLRAISAHHASLLIPNSSIRFYQPQEAADEIRSTFCRLRFFQHQQRQADYCRRSEVVQHPGNKRRSILPGMWQVSRL